MKRHYREEVADSVVSGETIVDIHEIALQLHSRIRHDDGMPFAFSLSHFAERVRFPTTQPASGSFPIRISQLESNAEHFPNLWDARDLSIYSSSLGKRLSHSVAIRYFGIHLHSCAWPRPSLSRDVPRLVHLGELAASRRAAVFRFSTARSQGDSYGVFGRRDMCGRDCFNPLSLLVGVFLLFSD